ncbi:MAG: 3-oxoacyl-[acyl-carrier-protein] reductase [Clostridia bacterium]|nr:3-oxoacyl-[acyl-carrier-protein] reductase [Erysipelotrichia bacterium]NCC87585.1 3-oxoacyl-[acyl-carrier-protein] reductase [Clostridia bacterium]
MENKVAFISGASRGIGKAIAIQLAKEGYHVVINYCGNKQKAEQVCETCKQYNVDAMCIQADVSDYAQVEQMVKQVVDKYGHIDVLVNNSGITKDNLLLRMSESDFSDVIDVNLKGCFHCIKHVSKVMMKQRSGSIINMASVIGLVGNIGQANYAASKAGIIGLTKASAKELAARGIRVNAIAPGFIDTEMTQILSDDVKAKIMESIPLKQFGSVEDVANMVVFLASDKSRYVSGQVLNVDGGMVM